MSDGMPSVRLRLYLHQRPNEGVAEGPQSFQLTAIGYLAERIAATVRRNDRVVVEGALFNRRFSREGQTHVRTEIRVNSLHRLQATNTTSSSDPEPSRTHYNRSFTNP